MDGFDLVEPFRQGLAWDDRRVGWPGRKRAERNAQVGEINAAARQCSAGAYSDAILCGAPRAQHRQPMKNGVGTGAVTYETLAICRTLAMARAVFEVLIAEKPGGRSMIRTRTRVVVRHREGDW